MVVEERCGRIAQSGNSLSSDRRHATGRITRMSYMTGQRGSTVPPTTVATPGMTARAGSPGKSTIDSRRHDRHIVAQATGAAGQRKPLELLDDQLGRCPGMVGEQTTQLPGGQPSSRGARVEQAIGVEHERRTRLELELKVAYVGAWAHTEHHPLHARTVGG